MDTDYESLWVGVAAFLPLADLSLATVLRKSELPESSVHGRHPSTVLHVQQTRYVKTKSSSWLMLIVHVNPGRQN
ncbi:hypothetical protein CONLIGDRAFT_336581 [Coniochaeta ligniaria NRRL 30616]|uniref:Uncharacterized protein n=1 Tax=Coniochaeta ligniaria NRRL 30616 TaxID=1408157 RepID=A0A1J7J8M1_9PEZI|nr:hypothetical protein CONLIGDRAFT_336581 [Coniochaeta ligniaria NRRL 30616]